MASLFSAVYSFIKAVPIIDQWVRSFFDFYISKQVEKIEQRWNDKAEKLRVAMLNLERAKTHEERRVQLAILSDIHKL